MANSKKILIRSEDIRQFIYCPRILFYRYVLRFRPLPTPKMKKGMKKHGKEKQKQMKSIKRAEQLQQDSNLDFHYREVYLENETLGLCGKVDLLEVKNDQFGGEEVSVTEVKTGMTKGKQIAEHHLMQLASQGLLVEQCLNVKVTTLRVHYTENNEEKVVLFDDGLRTKVLQVLIAIQQMVGEEEMPEPTNDVGKCKDCEYWLVCLRA